MANFEDLAEYEEFLKASAIKDKRMSYLRRLRETSGKPLLELSAREINGWIGGLGLAPTTHGVVVSYIKNALKYLNGGEAPAVCKQIAHRKVKALVSRVKSPDELLTDEEVESLIAATPRADLKALIALHVATGTRVAEILDLDRGDVVFGRENGIEYVHLSIRETKTQTPRVVFTPDRRAIGYLREWLRAGAGTGPLWTFRSPQTYWKKLKDLGEKAKIAKNVYPRLFRHMRATELYDAPLSVQEAQMGWVPGSKMHAQYTHLRPEDSLRTILDREGPAAMDMTPEETMERAMAALLELSKDQARLRAFLEQVQISA